MRTFLNHIWEQCSLSDLSRVSNNIDKHGFPSFKKNVGLENRVNVRIVVDVERVEPECFG